MTAEGAEEKPTPLPGTSLPDDANVLRHIGGRYVHGETIDGNGICRRPADDDGSSVNWLEWFDPPPENQVSGVRSAARITYKASGVLVSLNVGQTKAYVAAEHPENLALGFVHDPLEAEGNHRADPSHALIKGLPLLETAESALVKDLLVACIKNRYPARG